MRTPHILTAVATDTPSETSTDDAGRMIILGDNGLIANGFLDEDLKALAENSTNGLLTRTGNGTVAARTITGTPGRVTVTNGDGVAGNPALDLDTLADGGGGSLLKFTRDSYGRVSGTSAVASADIPIPGADKQVLFNDGGVLGAEAGFEYDKALNILFVPSTGIVVGTAGLLYESSDSFYFERDGTYLKIDTSGVNSVFQINCDGTGVLTGSADGTFTWNSNTIWHAGNLLDIGTTDSSARTALGATTVGGNLFTATNPSALTFVRVNADNSVTFRSAANFRTDLGVGTGDSPTFAGVTATGAINSSSSSAGIGYTTGAGATVTQLTSKSTGVTINAVTGTITLNNSTLNAGVNTQFIMTNSALGATDMVLINHISGGTGGAYLVQAHPNGAGACAISIRNLTAGNLSEAPVLRFAIINSVNS